MRVTVMPIISIVFTCRHDINCNGVYDHDIMSPWTGRFQTQNPGFDACRQERQPPAIKDLYLPEVLTGMVGPEVVREANTAMQDVLDQYKASVGTDDLSPLQRAEALNKGAAKAAEPIVSALRGLQCAKHACAWHKVESVPSQVLTAHGPVETRVFRVRCSHVCKGERCELRYDGAIDDIFNLYDDSMFQQAVLAKYFIEVVAGSPFGRIMSVLRDYERLLPVHQQMPLPCLEIFIEAIVSWSALVRREAPCVCPACGQHPPIIIADGTGLRLRRSLFDSLHAFCSPTMDAATLGQEPPDDGYEGGAYRWIGC